MAINAVQLLEAALPATRCKIRMDRTVQILFLYNYIHHQAMIADDEKTNK